MPLLQQMVLRIQSGDEQALHDLMQEMADELLLFATGLVKSSKLAEEIVSDTFVKIWHKKRKLHEIRDVKSYLYIITRNACFNHLRSSKEELISLDDIQDFQLPAMHSSDRESFQEEMLELIHQAIDSLPPKCKMAFSLAKIQGLRYKEISNIMGISVNTINNHIAKALELILEALNEHKDLTPPSSKKLLSIMLGITL